VPKIPKFKTEEEEAEFWETHSIADYWDELSRVDVEINPKLKEKIRRRAPLKPITLRLTEEQIAEAKRLADDKGIPYQVLLRLWIAEGIKEEKKKAI